MQSYHPEVIIICKESFIHGLNVFLHDNKTLHFTIILVITLHNSYFLHIIDFIYLYF